MTLLETIEKATEGSRELDAEIDAALFGGKAAHTFTTDTPGGRLRRSYGAGTVFLNPDPMDNGGHVLTRHHRAAPNYTTSLDAAVALVERLLPVNRLDICMDPSGVSAKIVWWPKGLAENEHTITAEGLGWTPALSIVLATLRAIDTCSGREGE